VYRLLWRHLLLQKFDGQAGEIARSIDDGDEPAARKFSFRNSSAPGCVHAGEEPAMLRQIRFGSKGDMPGTTASGAQRPFRQISNTASGHEALVIVLPVPDRHPGNRNFDALADPAAVDMPVACLLNRTVKGLGA